MTRETRGGGPRRSRLMSIDQRVACRRAPTLPGDLPRAGEWKREDHKGTPIHVFSGLGWRINVMVESCARDADLQEAIAEELDAAGDDSDPAGFGMMAYVTLEPSRAPQDAVDLQMAILEMLCETCDGVV